MSLRIKNHSASTQSIHALFTLSNETAAVLGDYIDLSTGGTATKQLDDGADSIYAVLDDWATGVTTATLSAGVDPDEQFSPHAAYGTADCGVMQTWDTRAIPRVYMYDGNNTRVEIAAGIRNTAPTMRIDGDRCKQAIWETHINGWHVWHCLTIFASQAIARFQTIVMWSDETYSTAWFRPCRNLTFDYGMEVQPLFQANEGWQYFNANKTVYLNLNFANASWYDGWENWANNIYHGRHICLEGWMFGRTATVVSEDETAFAACAELDAVGGTAEWDGSYLASGAIAAVPLHTDIVQPNWAETDRSYVTWDRGYGGTTSVQSQGLMMARYSRSQSLQGTYGMHMGSAVIRGYQELRDYRAALRHYGMRPCYMKRDGTWPQVSTTYDLQLSLDQSYPHNNSGVWYCGHNFGRAYNRQAGTGDLNRLLPPKTSTDGLGGEQYTINLLTAYYQLAKHDYFAYRLCEMNVIWHRLNQRRGEPYNRGSAMSGHREWGRVMNGAMQLYSLLPNWQSDLAASCFAPIGSYGAAMHTNIQYRSHPPTGNVYTMGSFTRTLTPAAGYEQWNRATDSLFEHIGALGAYILYRFTGDTFYQDVWERVSVSCLKYLTVFIPAGSVNGNGDTYTYGGWYPTYEVLIHPDGIELPASMRTGSTSSAGIATSGMANTGGLALNRWCIGAIELYSRIGQDPVAKGIALDIYNTMLLYGGGQPYGWLEASFIASAGYT